jgi:hypothetical protein
MSHAGQVVVRGPATRRTGSIPPILECRASLQAQLWIDDTINESLLQAVAAFIPDELGRHEFIDDIFSMVEELRELGAPLDAARATTAVLKNFQARYEAGRD